MSIQFHATPKEIFEFAAAAAMQHKLAIIAMDFPPVSYRQVLASELPRLTDTESVIRLILKPESPPTSELDDECESNSIIIDLSRPKNSALRQSLISVRGQSVEISELWKNVSGMLRKITKTGVSTTARSDRATRLYKAFRYTEGAKSLAASGIVMLPFAGGVELKLGG